MRRFLGFLAVFLFLAGTWLAGAGVAEAAERLMAATPFGETLRSDAARAAAFIQLRGKAAQAGKVRVIVGLRVPFAAEGQLSAAVALRQRSDITAAGAAVVNRLGATTPKALRSFDSLPIMALDVTPAELDRLAADPAVTSLTEDRLNRPMLAQSVPLIQGDKAWAAGYRGLGQTIAIIDTGVDSSHPFLFGKVVSEACFSTGGWCPGGKTTSLEPGSGRPCPHAECAHGTHVAGIAAGKGPDFSGVAKDAGIIAIQVFSPVGKEARAYDSDIIAGLARVYALRNTYPIAAVNMSLGSGSFSGYCDSLTPYLTAISTLRAAGIATVIASGNDGATDAISAPACISSAVSVGSVWNAAFPPSAQRCSLETTFADKVACYSNSAPILSLLAPGSLITSSVPGRRYAAYDGTSMAAPHVAGAWAVLKEKVPGAGVTEVLAALQQTGRPVTDYRNGLVKPRIDVMAALGRFSDPRMPLTYVRGGTAAGTVSFSPAGTAATCGDDCVNRFAANTTVTLTATPGAGAQFYGWSGACTGKGSCSVKMSAAQNVYAIFYTGDTLDLSYSKSGPGNGSVSFSASGFTASCAANCLQSYWKNASVTLTAMAGQDDSFTGWSGACKGRKTTCIVRLARAKAVTASFEKTPVYRLDYTQQGSGSGGISFSDGTKACTASCTRDFMGGTKVTISALADTASAFDGWGGACKGRKSACTMTFRGPAALTTTFKPATATAAR